MKPATDDSLQRRKILSGLMKLLVLTGLIFVSVPFIASFSSTSTENKSSANEGWILTFPLDGLTAGEVKTLSWRGGEVWVYHRTEKEQGALIQHHLLRDALSDKSDQPASMKNDFRSASEKYFVFIPLENKRGCQVRLDRDSGDDSIFAEPCYGARYDAAGRILQNSGQPDQLNLPVPKYIIEDGSLKVAAWTPKIK